MSSPKRILFVDNLPADREPNVEYLVASGFEVKVAGSPEEARPLFASERFDLVVIDLRLVDEADPQDFSGLALARELRQGRDRTVPRIIYSNYRTLETVLAALGPDAEGLPPAVGFVSKSDGPDALVGAIRLALSHLPSEVETRLRKSLGVETPVELPHKLQQMGMDRSNLELHRIFQDAERELSERRMQELTAAGTSHAWGLIAAAICLITICGTIVAHWLRLEELTVLPLVAGAIAEAASVLFFRRQTQLQKQVEASFDDVKWLAQIGALYRMAQDFPNERDRRRYRAEIIAQMLKRLEQR